MSIIDSSSHNHTLTVVPPTQASSVEKMFGSGESLECIYNTTSVTTPNSADWAIGNTFTIDLWVYFDTYYDNNNHFVTCVSDDQNSRWRFYYNPNTLRLVFDNLSGVPYDVIGAAWTPTNEQWYHLAVVRTGSTSGDWYFFVDGTQITPNISIEGGYNPTISNYGTLYIGMSPIANTIDGYIDELRISNVARWTDTFVKPTTPYIQDTNTLLLVHFDSPPTRYPIPTFYPEVA